MSRQITIYQVYAEDAPADTDVFLPTLREARAVKAQYEGNPSFSDYPAIVEIVEHKITLTGRGVCFALTNWPVR